MAVAETFSSRRSRGSRSETVQPMFDDWQQYHPSRFEEALARQYALPSDVGADTKYYSGSMASSDAFSVAGTMASSLYVSSTASTNVPSLDRSMHTLSSRSIRTDELSLPSMTSSTAATFGTPRQPAGTLQCAFAFLGCSDEFHDKRDWLTHSLSHFRGHHPPSRSQCPFCETRWSSSRDPDPWNARMEHVAQHHRNERLSTSYRADHHLFRHLFNIRVVDYAQYQELERRHWCDVTTAAYIEMYDPRGERRRGAPAGWTSHRV